MQFAFQGIRAGVVALILSSVIKLFKGAVKDIATLIIYGAVLILAFGGALVGKFLEAPLLEFLCSPVVLVVLAGVAGLLLNAGNGGRDK